MSLYKTGNAHQAYIFRLNKERNDCLLSDLDSQWFRDQEQLVEIDAADFLPGTEQLEYAHHVPIWAQDEAGQDGGARMAAAIGRKLLLVVPPAAIRPYNETGDNSSTAEPPTGDNNTHHHVCVPPGKDLLDFCYHNIEAFLNFQANTIAIPLV